MKASALPQKENAAIPSIETPEKTTHNPLGAKLSKQNPLQLAAVGRRATAVNPLQLKANSNGLPDALKAGIETLSGYRMDDVSVHYNSSKPASLFAHAYAQGNEIHIAPGQEKYLPHEAWHVVQQKQGRVQPNFSVKDKIRLNDSEVLESEADKMGAQAMNIAADPSIEPVDNFTNESSLSHQAACSSTVVQCERFIGSSASHHMHIEIAQPHYKYGKDRSSRIDIGPDIAYRAHDLQVVIDVLRGNADQYARACYNWCLRQISSLNRGNSEQAERRARRRGW